MKRKKRRKRETIFWVWGTLNKDRKVQVNQNLKIKMEVDRKAQINR
jgi:hypothetical protein